VPVEVAKRPAHVAWLNKAVPVAQASQLENAALGIKNLAYHIFLFINAIFS